VNTARFKLYKSESITILYNALIIILKKYSTQVTYCIILWAGNSVPKNRVSSFPKPHKPLLYPTHIPIYDGPILYTLLSRTDNVWIHWMGAFKKDDLNPDKIELIVEMEMARARPLRINTLWWFVCRCVYNMPPSSPKFAEATVKIGALLFQKTFHIHAPR